MRQIINIGPFRMQDALEIRGGKTIISIRIGGFAHNGSLHKALVLTLEVVRSNVDFIFIE